jgi:hypothetical protein
VVQIRQRTEKVSCSAHFVPDDYAPLAGTLDFEYLDDGAITRLDIPQDALVNLKGIFARFFEKYGVGNGAYVRLAIAATGRGRLCREVALGHEIAAQLLRCRRRDRASRTECLKTVAVIGSRIV